MPKKRTRVGLKIAKFPLMFASAFCFVIANSCKSSKAKKVWEGLGVLSGLPLILAEIET